MEEEAPVRIGVPDACLRDSTSVGRAHISEVGWVEDGMESVDASVIMRAYYLNLISDRQRQSMFAQIAKSGRTREPATLDPPVEKPTLMIELARRHCTSSAIHRKS